MDIEKLQIAALRFAKWLDGYGEISYDFQSFYASNLGRRAKALYYKKPFLGAVAVSPIIFCEAFVPSAKRLFWKPQRFPIADAHYAMSYLFLARVFKEEKYYRRAVGFLDVLEETRCKGYEHYCWGYPYNWETLRGTIREGTPLITSVPYVYEAFKQAHQMDPNDRWLGIMHSIAEHAYRDYKDIDTSPSASTCSYTPDPRDSIRVVNANAYRAFLLTSAALDFSDERYQRVAQRNLNFVLEAQNPDGSWYYATDGQRDFIDHFHTCFVLKALVKIEILTGSSQCRNAIERGVSYYLRNLFDGRGLPRPFSRPPRWIIYRRELYDFAECVNLGTLVRGRFPDFDDAVSVALNDILTVWQKEDGSFRSRQLVFGWDDTPMHRWSQSQMFRSLCQLLSVETQSTLGIGMKRRTDDLLETFPRV
jgi:hypothetical protein